MGRKVFEEESLLFIVPMLEIVKNWKQPKCHYMENGEQIKYKVENNIDDSQKRCWTKKQVAEKC